MRSPAGYIRLAPTAPLRLIDSTPDPASSTRAHPIEPSDDGWDADAAEVVAWIGAGGYPAGAREDLLRDVIALWDDFGPDHSAWNTMATLLTTLAAVRDAPGAETPAFAALSELTEHLEGCVSGAAGAEEQASAALRRVAALVGSAARG